MRTNQHRKLTAWARAGLFPVAILSDCALYLSHGPSPLDFMPHADDGKPLPGGFRLGVSPGMVKHEGTRDFLWLARTIEDDQINPARHIKGDDAPESGEQETDVGILGDSLEKAAAANTTRPIPKSAGAQMRFLVKQHKGSTKAVAHLLGISQRTVER